MLKEKIQQDFKEAFKGGEAVRTSTLKMLQSEIRNAEIAKKTKLVKVGEADIEAKSVLTDEEIAEVVAKEGKTRRDAIEIYKKEGRDDLYKRE